MSDNFKDIVKALSRRFVMEAVKTFDRATIVVVCSCWAAAVVMMVFALFTLSLSASTRRAAEAAAASEPVLPAISRKAISAQEAHNLMDRTQHRYPDLTFALGSDQSIAISASEGSKFKEWLAVLGYIDVLAPRYRWSIKELCVGKCGNGGLMRAVLTGEMIDFEAPASAKH